MSRWHVATRPSAYVIALAAGGVLIAGCGSSSSGASSTPNAAPSAAATGAAPSSGGSATAVTATETDFKISLSSTTFAPGAYTFTATNSGKVPHALEINGPGVANMTTSDIMPGSSATLAVTLRAGSYEIFCPVANHKALGMDLNITVGGAGGSGTTSSSSSGTSGGGLPGY
jgi:uncharacterized cupredoxin-like copper-binding protein